MSIIIAAPTFTNKTLKRLKIMALVLPVALSSQVVDDGGRSYSLSRARRTLDQTEGTLQHCLHSINLHHNKPYQHEPKRHKT